MKRVVYLAAVGLFSLAISAASAQADQWSDLSPTGKPQVMHTRMAPVIMHRVFPPYTGIHQYAPRAGRAAR